MSASTQLRRDIEKCAATTIFAHPSLSEYLETNEMMSTMFARSFHIEFADYDEIVSRSDVSGARIMLPVNAEYQAESLHSIRIRHAVELIIAVTNDVTGHSTYFAIRSGANFVVNIAIPGESQAEIICAQLQKFKPRAPETSRRTAFGPATTATPAELARSSVPSEVPSPERASPAGIDTSRKMLSRSESQLLGMLRTSMTVAEIARLNYMSERSMYRRIRHLYDAVGVAGRSQLVRSWTGESSAPRSGAPRLTGVPV
ncbi:hypothetical protein ACGFQG_20585 [Nocardia fluminea]|uniref:hypothetical protein n=1 Tax=Nocardia fluminea TaxID=134984 RepID=UPI00371C7213